MVTRFKLPSPAALLLLALAAGCAKAHELELPLPSDLSATDPGRYAWSGAVSVQGGPEEADGRSTWEPLSCTLRDGYLRVRFDLGDQPWPETFPDAARCRVGRHQVVVRPTGGSTGPVANGPLQDLYDQSVVLPRRQRHLASYRLPPTHRFLPAVVESGIRGVACRVERQRSFSVVVVSAEAGAENGARTEGSCALPLADGGTWSLTLSYADR